MREHALDRHESLARECHLLTDRAIGVEVETGRLAAGIERAILEIIGSGTEEKRQGEQAIARRLGELDGQAQGIFDAIRAGEPAEHPPRP